MVKLYFLLIALITLFSCRNNKVSFNNEDTNTLREINYIKNNKNLNIQNIDESIIELNDNHITNVINRLEIEENNNEEIINEWMIEHLNSSQDEDFFISKYYVYNNCTDEFSEKYNIKDHIDEYVGKIKRTGKQKIWKIGDATMLQENTKIYTWKQHMFLKIAVENDNYHVYTPMFETYNE
jgi:hypothetical protein